VPCVYATVATRGVSSDVRKVVSDVPCITLQHVVIILQRLVDMNQ